VAFLHRSCSATNGDGKWINNERMEFLGDAILDAIVGDIVYHNYPTKHEGFLTSTRSKIVQRESLNRCAVEMGLDKLLVYSSHLSTAHNNYIYGNALEALVAAVYLDKGYEKCFAFVRDVMIKKYIKLDSIARKDFNFKSMLIEWCQKNRLDISFPLIKSTMDEDGSPIFHTGINLVDEQIATGIGYSKKESQQNAAKEAIKLLRANRDLEERLIQKQQQKEEEETTENPLPTSDDSLDEEASIEPSEAES
jgi:ribonuclease-3